MPQDNYEIQIDSVKIKVGIIPEKQEYNIKIPSMSPGTRALVEEIKGELAGKITITAAEIVNPKAVDEMRKVLAKDTAELISAKLPHIEKTTRDYLVIEILNHTLGIGNIEFLLQDPLLEEIVIPRAGESVRAYHKKHRWLKTSIIVKTEAEIQNYSAILARRVGKQITVLEPLLDAHMVTGDRANAVLYPVSNRGNTITIRKFAREPWTITDMIKNKTISAETAALIWLCIQYEMNIIISGGTASGKTSMLNVLMAFTPTNQRVISIEDTRELQLPETLFWTPMTTRLAGAEGKGAVTMLNLLVNSLRMRPDRIILGEIRKGEDAEVMFEAMHTGHAVYATVHADSIFETVRRLINPPINVPSNLLEAVNLVVVMFRDRSRGLRRVYQVGELLPSEGKDGIMPNLLYRWEPTEDVIIKHADNKRLFGDISKHTGKTLADIQQDIKNRKSILDWMVKNNIRDLNSIAGVIQDYYLDPASVIKRISIKK